ncbi:MAG: hypothetical protein NTY77_07420 [Elusimicrobia bacterium]|nr:hypothetical protein [Elusimicrobiota bacterium]
MGLRAVTATRLFAGTLCLSLVFGASAAGSPMPPQGDDRQASRDAASALAAPSADPAPSLISDDDHIILRKDGPRPKSAPLLDHERRAVKGGGLGEGVKLETLLWGGGGAIIGSLAGPVGTIAGGAVGFLVGLTIGIVMPRKQSSAKFRG